MKIAFLSFYSGVVYRGVETFVHEVANRLQGFGHEVTVYQRGNKLSDSIYKTINVPTNVDWKKKGSYVPFLNYHSLKVKEFTKDVLFRISPDTNIVFPANGQWQSVLCSIWAKTHGKKIVISGQSGPGLDDRINLYTFPDKFFGLTDYQKKWAIRTNPFFKKIGKVPNGVDLGKFNKKGAGVDFGLPKPVILSVAAFDTWKRLDLTIKAVSKLKKGSLMLVGKGKEENKLDRLGNELLPGRFKTASFKYKEMPDVYRGADLFTFPTVPWESFGIALVEAMASGLPVVATSDPIRKEIIGDAGILVDPLDTKEYARALQKALDTNWKDKPEKQAKKFDWDLIAQDYERIFLSLLEKR